MRKFLKYVAIIMVLTLIFSGTALAKPKDTPPGKAKGQTSGNKTQTVEEKKLRITEETRERARVLDTLLEEMLDEELMEEEKTADEDQDADEAVDTDEEVDQDTAEDGDQDQDADGEEDADQDVDEEQSGEEEEDDAGLLRQEEQLRLRLQENPGDAKAMRKLAIIQKNLGKYDEALETCNSLVNSEGEQQKAMIIMAQTYKLMGDYEGAMARLQEILAYNPDAKVRAYMAILQEEEGEVEEAVENMEQALEEDPENGEYYEALGRMYQKTNRHGMKVFVEGKKPEFDVPPVIKDGRTLIPVRAIVNTMGADVDWDPENKIVTIVKDDKTITLQIDSNEVFVNGVPVTLDVPATIVEGRTMVPGRFVSEAFNAIVEWIGEYEMVVIDMPEEETGEETVEEGTEGDQTDETGDETDTGDDTGDQTGDETGDGTADSTSDEGGEETAQEQ